MKHFKAEGPLFKSVGIAGQGTSRRKVLLLGMGFFGLVFMAVVLLLLNTAEMDSAIYVIVPLFVLSFGFFILVIGRILGGGGLTVDTSTGEVYLRKAAGFGFGSRRIPRSDIQELVLQSYTYNQARNTSYRIMLHTQGGDFVPTALPFTDAVHAREVGNELSSLLSVTLRDNIEG